MLRFFSHESTSIASAATLLAVLSFGSRLLGVLRDRLLAGTFGAGDVLDAYYAAFRIPDFVFSLVVLGALSAGFIPIFTNLDESRAWRFANVLFSWLFVLLGGIMLLFIVVAPFLVGLITPGFSGPKLELTVTLSRIMALSPVLLGLSNIFGGMLQSRRRFFLYAISPALYNLGIIIGIVSLVPLFGVSGLAFGVVLGAALHFAVQCWAARAIGWRPRFVLEWSVELRQMLLLACSRVGGILFSQLDLFVATIFATTLAAGSLSIFQLANNIQIFPVGLIGIPFALAAFPALSQSAMKDLKRFRAELMETTLLILFFILPATVLLLMLRAQIVRVVLGGEAFDWKATVLAFQTLQWFAVSLFAQSLIPLFVRSLYALGSAAKPLLSSAAALVVAVIGYFLFARSLGVAGLALAASLGFLIQCAMLYGMLQYRVQAFEDGALLGSLARLLLASFVMAGWIQFMKAPVASIFGTSTFFGVAAQAAVAGFVGCFVYVLLCKLLGSPELQTVIAGARRRLVRQAPVPRETVS